MDRFELLHKYNILVRRGFAEPIVCGADGFTLTVRLNDGENPKLHCYMCDSDYYPSDREYETWQTAVEEKL